MKESKSCGATAHGHPHRREFGLPPGNEKLQIEMQAEMMQKMGEILSKYASRIADRPASAR